MMKAALAWAGVALAAPVWCQDPMPSQESLEHAFKSQKHFSPYAGRNFPTNVYWGDTHLHTGMSMDAGAFGARLTPKDAYRFARGEELTSSTGLDPALEPAGPPPAAAITPCEDRGSSRPGPCRR